MRFVEETGGSWTAEQLRAAEAEIEQQKREWEANRLATLKKEEEDEKRAAEEDEMLTYSREDAQNQVNNNKFNKRKPINRRLLKVKQNDRNIACNNSKINRKNMRGKVQVKKQIKRVVAQQTLEKRRALRNSSKTISRNINANVKNEQISSGSRRRIEPRQLVKRAASVRISSRLNKQTKRYNANDDTNASSDDDETLNVLSNSSKNNNGTEQMQQNELNDIGEQSGNSDRQHSEEFDDSECSLDVMVDSTDPQESDDAYTDENDSTIAHSDADDSNDTVDTENETTITRNNVSLNFSSSSSSNSNNKSNSQVNNHIDIDSPRTRSHGRVKIDLWTLDESQNLPELCAKRSLNKSNNSRKSTSIVQSTKEKSNDSICENGNGSSNDDDNISIDDCDTTKGYDSDSNQLNKISNAIGETKSMKQSKISDCFAKSTSRLSDNASSSSANAQATVNENNRKRKYGKNSDKQTPSPSKKINTHTTSSATPAASTANSKNISNHDNLHLNRSPKVVLNKHECDFQTQKSRLKS